MRPQGLEFVGAPVNIEFTLTTIYFQPIMLPAYVAVNSAQALLLLQHCDLQALHCDV